MKRFILWLCLLIPAVTHGQHTVRLSDKDENGNFKYTEKFVDVPPPKATPRVTSTIYSMVSPVYWGDTFNPGGQVEVRNARINKQGEVGTWSNPAVLNLVKGSIIYGNDFNQPPSHNNIGIIWKVKYVSVDPELPGLWPEKGREYLHVAANGGVGPAQFWSGVPWSASRPRNSYIALLNGMSTDPATLRYSNIPTPPAPPPAVYGSNVPQKDMNLFVCFRTHKGETAASPSVLIKAGKPDSGAHGMIQNVSIGEALPMGVLGFHVYLDGKRVPAPQCFGKAQTPDDWLWQPDQFSFDITRVDPDGPAHNPVAAPQSLLNPLQVAMKETMGNVIADTGDLPLYCPIIDEYAVYGGWPFKFLRKMSNGSSGAWKVTQQKVVPGAPADQPTYWPGIVVHNQYSIWEGLKLTMPWGSCGLCFADYSGGQAFGNQFIACAFIASCLDPITDIMRSPLWTTQGVRIVWECTSSGHSASELRFMDCMFLGVVAIWLEHNQSANIKFYRLHASSYYNDRRASVFWLDSPNQFDFRDGIFCDAPYNVIFNLGWAPKVTGDGLWVDGGCVSVVDFTNYQPGKISLSNAKLNFWVPDQDTRPNFARIINTTEPVVIELSKITAQYNLSTAQADVCSPAWYRADIRFSDTHLDDMLVLREPTKAQWLATIQNYAPPADWVNSQYPEQRDYFRRWAIYTNTPEPGMRLKVPEHQFTVPGYTITIPATVTPVPGQELKIPSITQNISIKVDGLPKNLIIPVNIPARTLTTTATNITNPAQLITVADRLVTVPETDIVFNSLTGRQKIRRVDWWSPVTFMAAP